jgi:hypothetical protein
MPSFVFGNGRGGPDQMKDNSLTRGLRRDAGLRRGMPVPFNLLG